MKKDSDFVAHVLDLLQAIGDVRSRAMFGGHGLYQEEESAVEGTSLPFWPLGDTL
ncbi:MAG: hypothetical protein AABY65_01325 [Nitrospirota bacterium]|jgi:TfoX/Sxy family transcriptional regulator of competence genes